MVNKLESWKEHRSFCNPFLYLRIWLGFSFLLLNHANIIIRLKKINTLVKNINKVFLIYEKNERN